MAKKKKKQAKVKKESSKKSKPVKAARKPVKAAKKPAKPVKKVASPKKAVKKISPKSVSNRIIESLLKEMEQEAKTTRKMLERIPEEKYEWAPHPKSMTIQRLATHIAELPSWVNMAINTDELDFNASKYVPRLVKNNAELLALLEKSLADGKASLMKANDDTLLGTWVMRMGDKILSRLSKGEVIRMAYCQIVHHRAQLGVFLRLLDVPIPGSYGPSADDPSF